MYKFKVTSPGIAEHRVWSSHAHKAMLDIPFRLQILVHNPHEIPGGGVDKNHYVRINRDVTALASGRMHTEARRKDHLMIGTSSSLQAFDCEDNRDLFFADVPDGSNGEVYLFCPRSPSHSHRLSLLVHPPCEALMPWCTLAEVVPRPRLSRSRCRRQGVDFRRATGAGWRLWSPPGI